MGPPRPGEPGSFPTDCITSRMEGAHPQEITPRQPLKWAELVPTRTYCLLGSWLLQQWQLPGVSYWKAPCQVHLSGPGSGLQVTLALPSEEMCTFV